MSGKPRFIVGSGIKAYFKNNRQQIFTRSELEQLFSERRYEWNLPVTMNDQRFIERLLTQNILEYAEIQFEGYASDKERFIVPGTTPFAVAATYNAKAFLSHYTAVFLAGLTTQVPKVIYISVEQSKKNTPRRILSQSDIDEAFARPQRQAGSRAIYKDYQLVLLAPKFSNRAGVTQVDGLPVSGLERTLIDCTVRPAYSGGVQAVLDLYRRALPSLSLNKLVAILEKMDFAYPYHQAIGFYLEKAGADPDRLEELRRFPRELDFYLTYDMRKTAYATSWRLYYPEGM